jgi:hypothetical protein
MLTGPWLVDQLLPKTIFDIFSSSHACNISEILSLVLKYLIILWHLLYLN